MCPEAIASVRQRRGVEASGRKGDFTCPGLDATPVDGHDDLFCFRVVGGLLFQYLTPPVAQPPLTVGRAFDIAWVTVQRGYRLVFITRHVIDLLEIRLGKFGG